ncbi:flavodoxin family protein [Actinophytocola oryzae]|uniref:Flavodoxin n=1 Tax=Actinophytocola oryzae TaxID=502181 RepID=A0A4R7V3Z2_9PSEU|nr:flavodoxin domain-containing protein [Actinophytocola oryzae]TDV44138.1 flavodoxin [Actinophytocola oryzae]
MTHTLVVFESMFGNTKKIAEAVADGLRTELTVEVAEARSAPAVLGSEVDLLVVGGPTHAFGMSRRSTRADAGRQGADREAAAGTGLREFVEGLAAGTARPAVAAFDTKVSRPRLPGSAARAARNRLRRAGFRTVSQAENFHVSGTPGPLLDGELARARVWGEQLTRHAHTQRSG